MKNTIICSAIALLVSGSVSAQTKFYKGNLEVSSKEVILNKDNNTLKVNLWLDTRTLDIPSRQTLTLTPVLRDNQGNEKVLPELWINGSNRQKVYNRLTAFGNNEPYRNAGSVVALNDVRSQGVSYTASTPYEGWMKNAALYLKEEDCGCAGKRVPFTENDLGKLFPIPAERYRPVPHVSFITPQAEAVKNRNESSEAYLDFKVGKYDIQPDFRRNPVELAKVNEMVNQITTDKNISVGTIKFIGKASPEGKFESNERLAENRAESLQEYVLSTHNLNRSYMQTASIGEDWDTFRTLVENSTVPNREEVLDIINSNDMPDRKEARLKSLHGGSTYKVLNEEIFPQLRRVECIVDYTVRAFSPEEGRKIITTHPQQLSLNEMFLVANTYDKGSQGFNQVFDVAVRMYPKDEVANSNAAAAAILAGDFNKARSYLDKSKKTPEYYNNLGIIYMLEGNLDKAEEYLTKAKEAGSIEALENLNEVKMKKADNEQFGSTPE